MFSLVWTTQSSEQYHKLKNRAEKSLDARKKSQKKKATRDEGLFKQVHKCLMLLGTNPRHPGLQTHEYHSLPHPYDKNQKGFEAYVQQHTSGAYRVFWCYGPDRGEITIIAITPHP